MAEKVAPPLADLNKQQEQEVKAAEAKKGIQSINVIAYLDPNSLVNFRVKEDVMKWFDIKNPEKLDTDTVFGTDTTPKTLTPGTGGVKTNPQTASELNAGSIQHSYKPMIGKAIKIPTNDNATAGSTNYMKRKYKGAERNVKFVTVRVPSSMSIAAIVLWINTCFRTVSRRPGMFIMPSGARVSINPSFTEKAKLPNRKAVSK